MILRVCGGARWWVDISEPFDFRTVRLQNGSEWTALEVRLVRLRLRGAFAFEVVRSAAAAAAATASKTLFMITCTCFKAASRRNTHLDEPSVWNWTGGKFENPACGQLAPGGPVFVIWY